MKKAKLNKHEEKNSNNKSTNEGGNKIVGFIISIIVIVAIFVGFYFLTEKILERMPEEETQEGTQEMVNVRKLNDINYSDVSKMVAKTYFLLFDKEDDEKNNMYDFYIDLLKASNFGIEFYYIDLSKEENKDILGKKESLKSLSKIKVKDTTLIFVNNGDITDTYVGSEEILDYLGGFFGSTESNSNSDSDEKESNSNSNKENSNSNSNKKDSNSNSNKKESNSNKK